MATSTLDRLDGARRFIAHAKIVGGMSRSQIAEAMARKYGIPAPTRRSLSNWFKDPELVALCRDLEALQRDLGPDADPDAVELPPQLDIARVDEAFFGMIDDAPSFAVLLFNLDHQDEVATPAAESKSWAALAPMPSDAVGDDEVQISPRVMTILEGEYASAAELEAACAQLVASDYQPHPAAAV